jgi:hypothetical protein
MLTVAKVAAAMQAVLTTTAETVARETGCVQRVRAFTGASLVQTLVFGWLAHPAATLVQLCQTAATRDVLVTPQGLDARFTPAAATCLQQVLTAAVQEVIATEPAALPLLDRFAAVVVQDSTVIRLPDALADTWAGCGGGSTATPGATAVLKLQVSLDLRGGRLVGPTLHPGREHDQRHAPDLRAWPADTLGLRDLGYFSLDSLAAQTAAGHWWLTRPKINTTIRSAAGPATTIPALVAEATGDLLDVPVWLGATQQLPCRLVAVRLPPAVAEPVRRKLRADARTQGRVVSAARLAAADWFVIVTTVPADQLSPREALILARVRWQIELLFRRWKSLGQIDQWRSENPDRILCEVYAKLLGMVVAHWITLIGVWDQPHRGLWAALTVVQTHAPDLARTFDDPSAVAAVLATIALVQCHTGRLTTRNTHPSTYQLLASEEVA